MKWLCKFWHNWEYMQEDVEFQVDGSGKPVVFFHELSESLIKNFNIKPQSKSCSMRICKRCTKKQIYYKGLIHNIFHEFLPDPNRKKTWLDYNHLTLQQLRQKRLKDLGLD